MKINGLLVLIALMFWLAYVNPHIWNWFVIIGLLFSFLYWFINYSGYNSDGGDSGSEKPKAISSSNLHNSGY